jgi:hypothetical protein
MESTAQEDRAIPRELADSPFDIITRFNYALRDATDPDAKPTQLTVGTGAACRAADCCGRGEQGLPVGNGQLLLRMSGLL